MFTYAAILVSPFYMLISIVRKNHVSLSTAPSSVYRVNEKFRNTILSEIHKLEINRGMEFIELEALIN